ncbi:penicillin-binding protein 2 [Puteibacter caeruleilacunae]|nr:penicillin-binding protein 2 [Puteibacter caeruleilacunae]
MDSYSKRKFIISGIFLMVGLLFIVKLFNLQILDTEFKQYATRNVLRKTVQYPSRGLIYDRNHKLLVYNQAAYDLLVTPREVKAFDTLMLCNILKIDIEDLRTGLKKATDYSRYKPSILVNQISSKQYALLQEKLYRFPGFFTQTRTIRDYPYRSAAHLLGGIGEVNSRDLKRDKYYSSGDYIGKGGVEKSYEEVLRGKKGIRFELKDAHNRVKGSYRGGELDTSAIRGRNVTLTIDADLQAYGEKLMQNKKGSIVAIDPSTGEVLCVVSSPAFDPTLLIGRERGKNYSVLLKDTLKPLFNRALMASYPPGSTFKMANALIGLQEKVIDFNTKIPCYGAFFYGNRSLGCHHKNEYGTSLIESVEMSCNTYYCNVFRYILEAPKFGTVKKGYENWIRHLHSMGFGIHLNTDFPRGEELTGLVPSTDYYEKRVFKGMRWRSLWIISLAIGQGELGVTPLQLTNYTAYLANRGHYYIPHVVKAVEGEEQIDERFLKPQQGTIDSAYFEPIIEGMYRVSLPPRGTARMSRIPGIEMCGKTGTAQNQGEDHSVFTAFAPKDKPKIAISVYVENAKWGSTYAAPIASLIMEKYLNDSIMESRKWLEKKMLDADLIHKGVNLLNH